MHGRRHVEVRNIKAYELFIFIVRAKYILDTLLVVGTHIHFAQVRLESIF